MLKRLDTRAAICALSDAGKSITEISKTLQTDDLSNSQEERGDGERPAHGRTQKKASSDA